MPTTNSGPTTMTISGGNLMKIAAQVYGDGTQWNRIAAINGLFDFIVTSTVTLVIAAPNPAAGNGGILGI
jgi:nucleoid-associated protein YgaU